jgi:NAD+ kinase
MKFSLLVRGGRPATQEFADRLVEEIEGAGGSVLDDAEAVPDMILAVGGDGTMLAAVQNAVAFDVPLLGFNLGTLGFLTEAEPGELSNVVNRLVTGDYEVSARLTVSAAIGGVSAVGVNDVVVEKVDSTRLAPDPGQCRNLRGRGWRLCRSADKSRFYS